MEEKDNILIKLSHYVVDDKTELSASVIKFFILESLAHDSSLGSIEQIKQYINDNFDLEFELVELTGVIDSLISEKKVISTGGRLLLESNTNREIQQQLNESKQQGENFRATLRSDLLELDPALSPSEIDDLTEDFNKYLNTLFTRLGAEGIHFLYPENNKITQLLESAVNNSIFRELPDRGQKVETFRKTKFTELLKLVSKQQAGYLASKLNANFVYTLVSIDPKCSTYLQKSITGYRLFLDTNFLYDLLGLHEQNLAEAAQTLVQFCKKFKFELFITTRTLEEFNISLSNAEIFLRHHPLPTSDPELLRAAASYTEEIYVKAYWREYAKNRTSLEEFINFYKNVKPLLQSYGIKISNDLVKTVKESKEELQEIVKGVKQFAPNKNDATAEHDAFHILLLKKTREKDKSQGSLEVRHWFLTNDRSLLHYELVAQRRNRSYSPLCMLPINLLQILRPLLPRSSNYEQSLLGFISGYHHATQGLIPASLAFEILERIDRYKTKPKDIAIKILTDTHFTHRLKNIKNKEEKEAAIDSELLKNAEIAITEKTSLLKTSKTLGNKVYDLEKENEELKKFKEEVQLAKAKRMVVLRWFSFVAVNLVFDLAIVLGANKVIVSLQLSGWLGVVIVLLGFAAIFTVLLISSHLLPEEKGSKLREDVKTLYLKTASFFSQGEKKD